MGWVHRFDLAELQKKYGLDVFLETGVGNGDGVMAAQKHPFKRIISIEIMPEQAKRMTEKFSGDKRVEIICGDTLSVLPCLLKGLDSNICFWLDAHFPGADIGMGRHNDNIDEDLRLPLEKELFLIKDLRGGKDVVLFDDLKIYRFQGRDCWRGDICPRRKFTSDEFYKEILSKTHDCTLDDSDTGYCQLTPKL